MYEYDTLLVNLDLADRLIDFIIYYPYLPPYAIITVKYDPRWNLDVFEPLLFLKTYAYVSEVYESRDYIYLKCLWGNLDDILFNDYGVDVEEYDEYSKGGWDNPELLKVIKRDYPDIFKKYNMILNYLEVYSRERDIEVFEETSGKGDLSILIRMKIVGDRIEIVKTLLEVIRKAYMKAYNVDDKKLRFEKDETYYRLINELKELIHRARREVVEYSRKGRSIRGLLISNLPSKPRLKIFE